VDKICRLHLPKIMNRFPRTANDEISFVAKYDLLITSFKTCYLKSHKEKHFIAVVSQKIKMLARFLLGMKSENSLILPYKIVFFISILI